jgi:4'-phosphopantetheinyl transferase EntD
MVFRSLLDSAVLVAQMQPSQADVSLLHPLEQKYIAFAVDSRRREFTAGRLLAKQLFTAAAVPPQPLLNAADRAPIWPASWVGSITHCADLCAVAICSSQRLSGLGIDIEPAEALPEKLAALIMLPEDYAALAILPPPLRNLAGRIIFSAKEAVYKAVYPQTRQFLEFLQVHIRFSDLQTFQAEFAVNPAGYNKFNLQGRFAVHNGYIATAVCFG